jgi:transcriptional regulator with XRE-family HTH domain
MTPAQYAAAIERLGLSQRKAGAFLGIDERQSRRWIAGEARVQESADKLLLLMIGLKLTPEEADEIINKERKKIARKGC